MYMYTYKYSHELDWNGRLICQIILTKHEAWLHSGIAIRERKQVQLSSKHYVQRYYTSIIRLNRQALFRAFIRWL